MTAMSVPAESLRDEAVEYADRIRQAGGETELRVWSDTPMTFGVWWHEGVRGATRRLLRRSGSYAVRRASVLTLTPRRRR